MKIEKAVDTDGLTISLSVCDDTVILMFHTGDRETAKEVAGEIQKGIDACHINMRRFPVPDGEGPGRTRQ